MLTVKSQGLLLKPAGPSGRPSKGAQDDEEEEEEEEDDESGGQNSRYHVVGASDTMRMAIPKLLRGDAEERTFGERMSVIEKRNIAKLHDHQSSKDDKRSTKKGEDVRYPSPPVSCHHSLRVCSHSFCMCVRFFRRPPLLPRSVSLLHKHSNRATQAPSTTFSTSPISSQSTKPSRNSPPSSFFLSYCISLTRYEQRSSLLRAASRYKLVSVTQTRSSPTHAHVPRLPCQFSQFQSNPKFGMTLIQWLRSILINHTSYLMTVPELVKSLSSLYGAVDQRLTVFKDLLKLDGTGSCLHILGHSPW